MTIDIDAIRRRELAATPGPWGVGNGHHIVRDLEVTGVGSFSCTSPVAEVASEMDREAWRTDSSNGTDPRADAEFIAHARTDIPALLAELDRVRADLAAAHNHAHRQDTNLQQIARAKDEIAAERDQARRLAALTAEQEAANAQIIVDTRAERDALMPVVEAAKAWAKFEGLTEQNNLTAAVDALTEAEVAR